MNSTPTTHQFVCILNKKIELGRAFNALGHMTAGLIPQIEDVSSLRLQDYTDKDGTTHPSISDNPYIVLRAKNSNQIRTLRSTLIEQNVPFTDFTDTMIVGTFVEQHQRTQETPEESLEYFGICFFMESDKARELTKKFSLYS